MMMIIIMNSFCIHIHVYICTYASIGSVCVWDALLFVGGVVGYC